MTLKTQVVGFLQYAQGDNVQTYLERWLAQSWRMTDGLFDPVTGHKHTGSGSSGGLVGCVLKGSYVQAVAFSLSNASTWTETPVQVTATCTGVRVRMEFTSTISSGTKGQRTLWGMMVDGAAPAAVLGAVDAPDNNYVCSVAGTYYVVPSAGSHRLALGLYGPVGAQISNVVTSTLYVTEQNP